MALVLPGSVLPLNTGGLDLQTFAWDHQIYRCVFLSAVVILIYDHILTIEAEVEWVWLSPGRRSAYWFFLVRYTALVPTAVFSIFYFGDFLPRGISNHVAYPCFLTSRSALLVDITLAHRVIAMYGLNLRVLALLMVSGAVGCALAIWTIVGYGHPTMLSAPGYTGCHTAIPKSTLVGDIFVLVLTLHRAYVDRDIAQMLGDSLLKVMARDGAMYFAIILLANLASVLTIYLGDILLAGILSWFTTSLCVTLICRLMLNLHEAAHVGKGSETFELGSIHSAESQRPQAHTMDRVDESI
ncbi:hypothetical protein C8J57DRAFT_1530658 [Mycena rebaudengoi]|nr:hypothetical protein C8J57DRAFT_1530658 [Mycena rebaudengoi]